VIRWHSGLIRKNFQTHVKIPRRFPDFSKLCKLPEYSRFSRIMGALHPTYHVQLEVIFHLHTQICTRLHCVVMRGAGSHKHLRISWEPNQHMMNITDISQVNIIYAVVCSENLYVITHLLDWKFAWQHLVQCKHIQCTTSVTITCTHAKRFCSKPRSQTRIWMYSENSCLLI
jgi:hypothetical protein